jgi:hypothetical protein
MGKKKKTLQDVQKDVGEECKVVLKAFNNNAWGAQLLVYSW